MFPCLSEQLHFVSFVFIQNAKIRKPKMKNKKSIHLGVRISPQTYELIKSECAKNRLPVSWFVRILLNKALEQGQVNNIRIPYR